MYTNVRCSVRVIDSIHTFLAARIHKVVMETVYGSFGLWAAFHARAPLVPAAATAAADEGECEIL